MGNADQVLLQRIMQNMQSCILGKTREIELLVTALLARGHVLLEDVPGTGKTVLIKALAKSIQGQFRRIQCNPDLLPSDITGFSIYHPKSESFVFKPGPIFTNILLVDEINRTTTKTQSALLEAMEELHVTVDGETYPLPHPFLLLATQNPMDFDGTYALPEAQMDRFMFKFHLGYPDQDHELEMVQTQHKIHPLHALEEVASIEEMIALQQKVDDIHVDHTVSEYAVFIVRQTRHHPQILLGVSPRGTLALIHAAKAYALLKGRDYVLPDDIKFLAPYVLCHRMILHAEARIEGWSVDSILNSIIQHARVHIRMVK